MPGYDGTGPEGKGFFGRRLGPCAEGEINTGHGFFFLRRGWGGRGRGYRMFPTRFSDNKTGLEVEKSRLEKRFNDVNQQIGDVKKDQ